MKKFYRKFFANSSLDHEQSSGKGHTKASFGELQEHHDSQTRELLQMVTGLTAEIEGSVDISGMDKQRVAMLYHRRAVAYESLGDWESVLADCNRTAELNPDDLNVLVVRGNAKGMLGDLEGCIQDASSVLSSIPCDATALCNRGVAYRLLGRLDRALDDISSAIKLRPSDADQYLTRANIYRQLRQWANMVKDCTSALELVSDDVSAIITRAVALGKLGKMDEAMEDCNKALELNPRCAVAYANRALLHRSRKCWDKVVMDCSSALALSASDPPTLCTRAVAYGNLGDLDKLIEDCTSAIALNKNFVQAYLNRGSGLLRQGKWEEAEKDFCKVLDLDPDNLQAINQRGMARRKAGKFEAAESDFTVLLEKVQDDAAFQAKALASRATVRCQLHKWSDAIDDAGRAMLLDPTHGAQLNVMRVKALQMQENEHKESEKRAFEMSQLLIAEEEMEKNQNQQKPKSKNKKAKSKKGPAPKHQKENKGSSSAQHSKNSKPSDEQQTALTQPSDQSNAGHQKPAKKKEKKKKKKKNRTDDGGNQIKELPPNEDQGGTKCMGINSVQSPGTCDPNDIELQETSNSSSKEKEESLFKRMWRSFNMFEDKGNLVPGGLQACRDIFEMNEKRSKTISELASSQQTITEETQESSLDTKESHIEVMKAEPLFKIGNLTFDSKKVIGTGSFGTKVFAGEHREWGPVAVKVMEKAEQPIVEDTARAESAMYRMINRVQTHPNVVRYFGIEEDELNAYLAIELCHCSLWEIFKKEGLQNERAWFRRPDVWPDVVSQLVQGTKFLHDQNVVHGDLRPKNVLFDVNGTLKLTDFGLSRKVEESDASFSWTHGDPNGMGGWFAPEVYRKERKTMAVDIFSLGCVLYYILSDGQHPFNSNPFDVVTGKVDLSAIEDLPEALDLIGSMLNSSAEQRPGIQDVGNHPFVWDLTRKLQYIEDVSNMLDSKRLLKAEIDEIHVAPSTQGSGQQDWIEFLHSSLVASVERFRTYDTTSTADLLRFIRNLNQHFMDQSEDAINMLKPSTWEKEESVWYEKVMSQPKLQKEAIMKYFLEKLPSIIIKLWRALKDNMKDDKWEMSKVL